MIIKIEKFRQGKLLVSLEADVEGEASGKLLAFAQESVKTACMSALDSAIGKTLEKGVKYEREKHFTRETALTAFKCPEGVKSAKVEVVGDWEKTSGGVSKAELAASGMAALRAKGVGEDVIAAVLAAQGLTYSAPAGETPAQGEAEIVEG